VAWCAFAVFVALFVTSCSYSYYKLQPQEEQLLAAVLGRDDADLEQHNPFDASTACLDADDDVSDALAATEADAVDGQAANASLGQTTSRTAAAAAAAAPAAAGDPAAVPPAVLKFAGSCCYSGRPSSEGSSRSMVSASGSSGSSGRAKHTLAEIDALLEALQVHHSCCAGHGPVLGSSRPSVATLSSTQGRLL
jgi:hypothetical protein